MKITVNYSKENAELLNNYLSGALHDLYIDSLETNNGYLCCFFTRFACEKAIESHEKKHSYWLAPAITSKLTIKTDFSFTKTDEEDWINGFELKKNKLLFLTIMNIYLIPLPTEICIKDISEPDFEHAKKITSKRMFELELEYLRKAQLA